MTRYGVILVTLTDSNPKPASTPVSLGGVRGGPKVKTLRKGAWWLPQLASGVGLFLFVVYATWTAFRNGHYYVGNGRDYLSPFYSPCLTSSCVNTSNHVFNWWKLSPALLILIFPGGFRATCYYYRKAYYRSFWFSPPACGVTEPHKKYSGETKFPLILNNIHRYFWYFAVVFAGILTYDAVLAFRFSGGIGIGLGTLIFIINAVLIWLYTLSCHACRHLCGGHTNTFSKAPVRYWFWKKISVINPHHMLFAWLSLVWIGFTDFYVYLVAMGTIHDPKFF
ncbi:MAG: hypothetical protein HKL80_03585 [Acidimicrobiales bacterium]|nr:hypothetical protein [Acidimicrobiales bacterium]